MGFGKLEGGEITETDPGQEKRLKNSKREKNRKKGRGKRWRRACNWGGRPRLNRWNAAQTGAGKNRNTGGGVSPSYHQEG